MYEFDFISAGASRDSLLRALVSGNWPFLHPSVRASSRVAAAVVWGKIRILTSLPTWLVGLVLSSSNLG